jgi:cupin 2 domain-containing protein
MVQVRNLFDALPTPTTGEVFETLLRHPGARIERIVSSDAPEPTLYDQDHDEWVLLLQGEATLEVEDRAVTLRAGDTLFLPAHSPHRLVAASVQPCCIWLAIHLRR